jgi:hypothetical protein
MGLALLIGSGVLLAGAVLVRRFLPAERGSAVVETASPEVLPLVQVQRAA